MIYKVCIIVPVYNVSKYIERCVRSLFEQTFDDIQYIFVDDCTPDNSMEILKKIIEDYPKRQNFITIVPHKKNRGLAAARITGLNWSEAEYILNIDSDDYIELNMVELMYDKAIDGSADIVVCDFLLDWGKAIKISYQFYTSNNVEYTKLLLSGKVLPGVVNKMIKSVLYKENGIYPIEEINMGEDYVTTPRLAYFARKISKVDLPLYHYVQTNNNSYTKSFSEKSSANIIAAVGVLNDFFTKVLDKELYAESLLEGKLRKKISLLMESHPEIRKKIANLYPETNEILSLVSIRLEERISLFLANRRYFYALNIFLFIYWNLLEFIQIIKGRRKK